MTDASAQVLWWRDQTPFGQPVATGGFSETPLRFPGQIADPESGLAYNYFRDYDPALGRYIQSDPIGLRGGLNTYGYVEGNPLRYVDPKGLYAIVLPRPIWPSLPGVRPIPPGPIDPLPPMIMPRDDAAPNDGDGATDRFEYRKNHEYWRYKNICDEPPPPGLDACQSAIWRYTRLQRCKSARLDWDKHWGPGRGHAGQIEQIDRAIENANKAIQRNCNLACLRD